MPKWMSVVQAAAELDVGPRQVRNLIASGALDAQRVGRSWVVEAGSVRSQASRPSRPGRPLSPQRAWQVLGVVDHALRPDDVRAPVIEDRRLRYHLRQLLIGAPALDDWDAWLRNRGEHRRVWFHPAARIRDDPRVEPADVSALLGLPVGDLARVYVDAKDVEELVADHRGRILSPGDSSRDVVHLMVVDDGVGPWRAHVAAAGIVDLISHRDARVHHAATSLLSAGISDASIGRASGRDRT